MHLNSATYVELIVSVDLAGRAIEQALLSLWDELSEYTHRPWHPEGM